MKIFGERLKELRTEHKFTQKNLGELLGVSHNTIHSWESNLQEPSLEMLVRLTDIFDVSCDYFLGKSDI